MYIDKNQVSILEKEVPWSNFQFARGDKKMGARISLTFRKWRNES